jgi:hypothetical protein
MLALGAASCFGGIGNDLNGTCKRGESCVCDIIGNCTRTCPGGGCAFECRGTSNCTLDCAAGGCDAICANTGNCIVGCEGGGCTISCQQNTGNCILNGPMDLSASQQDLSVPRDFSSVD